MIAGRTWTRSFSPTFAEPALEQAWRSVHDTFQVLKLNRVPVLHLRWVFAQALLFSLRREDNVCMAVFTVRNPDEVDAPAIERMLMEFHSLSR